MATINLKIKSDFEQAENDFKQLSQLSESTRKQIDKFQKSFKTEQIDKFIGKNRLNAVAVKATRGEFASLQSEYKGLEREIQRLIKRGLSPQSAEIKKLTTRYDKLGKEIDQVNRSSKRSSSAFKGISNGMMKIGMATAGVMAMVASMKKLVDITTAQQKAENQLDAVLASTGNAAGVTAQEMKDLATSLQQVTTYGDETIIGAENILLTFTQIGKDVLPDATKAVLNVSTAMGQDLKSSAIQVGKALNDPATGLSALTRTGILFTDSQKEAITAMVEMGDKAGAQTLILKELETQFGGSAEAAAKTLGGGFEQLANSAGDAFEILGKEMSPGLNDLTNSMMVAMASGGGLAKMLGAVGKIASKLATSIALVVDTFSSLLLLQEMDQLELKMSLVTARAEDVGERLMEMKKAGQENTPEWIKLRAELELLAFQQQQLNGDYKESTKSIINQAEALESNIDSLFGIEQTQDDIKKTSGNMAAALQASTGVINDMTDATKKSNEESKTFIQRLESIKVSEQAAQNERINQAQEFFTARSEMEGLDHESRLEFLKSQNDVIRDMEFANNDERLAAEIAVNQAIEAEKQRHFQSMILFSQMSISATGDLVGSLQQIMKNAGKESHALAVAGKGIAMAEAAINSYLAFTAALAQVPYPFNFVAAGITLAAGLAKQVAIATTPIPSAETGISNYTVPESRSTRLDSAAVMAQGGEEISVTPRGESGGGETSVNVQIGEDVIYRVVQKGIRNGNIDINDRNIGSGIFV